MNVLIPANTFWNTDSRPTIKILQLGDGIWNKFGNFTFGVTLLIYGTLSLVGLGVYWYIKKNNY